MFNITSLCIDDIIQIIEEDYCGDDELTKTMLIKKAMNLEKHEMKWLASKLADAFCNCCFWENLADRFKQIVEEENGTK